MEKKGFSNLAEFQQLSDMIVKLLKTNSGMHSNKYKKHLANKIKEG